MKKLTIILCALLAACLAISACTALADVVPEPEAGKKFNSDWAVPDGLAEIVYEEEGYKISLDLMKKEDETGTLWEYSCLYAADQDALVSVSSCRTDYIYDPDTGEKAYAVPSYDEDDDESSAAVFTIDADGFLIWKDGRGDAGAGLKFLNIGPYDGNWSNEAEKTSVEIKWNGTASDDMFYTVYLTVDQPDGNGFTQYTLNGSYDSATGKLIANGTRALYTDNGEGGFDIKEDSEDQEAVFSMTEDGKLLYENAGIELVQ